LCLFLSSIDARTAWGKVSMEMDSQRRPLIHLTSEHLISSSECRPLLRSAIPKQFARPYWDDMSPCQYSYACTHKCVYCDCTQTWLVSRCSRHPAPNTCKLSSVGHRHYIREAERSAISLVSTAVPRYEKRKVHSCTGTEALYRPYGP